MISFGHLPASGGLAQPRGSLVAWPRWFEAYLLSLPTPLERCLYLLILYNHLDEATPSYYITRILFIGSEQCFSIYTLQSGQVGARESKTLVNHEPPPNCSFVFPGPLPKTTLALRPSAINVMVPAALGALVGTPYVTPTSLCSSSVTVEFTVFTCLVYSSTLAPLPAVVPENVKSCSVVPKLKELFMAEKYSAEPNWVVVRKEPEKSGCAAGRMVCGTREPPLMSKREGVLEERLKFCTPDGKTDAPLTPRKRPRVRVALIPREPSGAE